MKNAHIMFGLPCSGKSSYIDKYLDGIHVVSADDIKTDIMKYHGGTWSGHHQASVKRAEKEVYRCADEGIDFVMDGGGINNSYTKRIVTKLKEKGYRVVLVHVDTPVAVCLLRNEDRGDRRIDPDHIIHKSYKLNNCLAELLPLVDTDVCYSHEFDHVFVDMDGVLAAIQPLVRNSEGNIDFVTGRMFRYSKPVRHVIDQVRRMHDAGKTVHIMSACPDSLCQQDKEDWLAAYVPFIPKNNYYFVGNAKFKHVMLSHLIRKMKLDRTKVLVIDDSLEIINSMIGKGIVAVHPTTI